MTIFLAGLNTIPKSYYEAAQIDGANFWQRLRYVTLPMLSGAIMINLVFGITRRTVFNAEDIPYWPLE